MSAYEDYLNSLQQQDVKQQKLVSSLSEAATTNPDEFAQMKALSKAASVSIDALPDYKEEAQQAKYLGEVGLDRLWKDAPKTTNYLTNPDNAKLAKDDIENLTGFEKAWDFTKNRGRALAASIPQMNAGLWGVAAAPFELLGIDSVGGYLRDQQKITEGMAKRWGPQDKPGWLTNSFDQGLTSAGTNLLSLPLAFLPGGQNAALTSMVAPVFGQAYGKGRDKGLSPAQSIQYGTQDAAAEWVFERYGLGNLVGNVKAGTGFGRTLLEYIAREVPSEMATTVQQSFNEYANVNPDKPFGAWISQLPDELAQTVVATLVGGGTVATTVKAADKALGYVTGREQQAKEAEALGQMFDQMNKLAEASKLRERDPESAQAFFQSVIEEGSDSVWITAEALAQSGLADRIAQAIPEVAEQLGTAAETHHDIRLPIAQLMATVAGPELAQSIIPHVSDTPGGFTQTTAQEYLQSGQAQELQALVERTLAEKATDDVFKTSMQAVKDNIKAQLDQTGRFTSTVNESYATLVGNWYGVTAAKLGMTPEKLFEKYQLKIGAESVAGGQEFAQITPEQAMATNVVMEMPSDPTFSEAVGNTPGAQITENGLLIDLVRYQKPEQEGAQAIRTGVFYLPNGAATAKHYKTGKTGYGGTEKYEGETLIRRPMFVKGATGGKAPEVAYDQIKGKKAYEAMRSDVLKVALGWGKTPQQKVEGVRQVLEQYGANPDLAYEIVRVSKEGNTLPYAVQENIVAHAVREAGYDAVVGYSKGKAGANISEVFDVREQTFPARGMESDVHESFMQSAFTADTIEVDGKVRPTTNSNGKPIAQTEGGLRNFWHWFGDSKVVDVDGRPLVVYHGSPDLRFLKEDGTFKSQKDRIGFGRAEAAHWFASDMRTAKSYADPHRAFDYQRAEEGVIEAYIKLENPLIVEAGGMEWRTAQKRGQTSDVIEQAREGGHDGVVIKNVKDDYNNGVRTPKTTTYTVFKSEQIKSATGNRGTFDPADANILNQSAGNRGAFNPATLQVTLLKAADLSTFLHESAHFFHEVQFDLAAKLQRDAQATGFDTLTDEEQQFLRDQQAVLDWFGLRSFDEWANLDFEEKRTYHERFAESFEAYLFDGKAPSIELQGAFQQFRSWLVNVYKSLKDFLAGHPEAGKLNDDVRAVFDRMLATTEQIQLAEQARSMMPLFTSAEQAGMTVEEFAAYQNLDVQASLDAIDDLQAKGLRDMQWLHNARGRIIKQLQKQAKEQRAAVEMDARREIMSQPIYRAWQFLTGKMTADDKVETPKPPKSDPDMVDETMDSLFVAIAKLGGIDKEEVVKTWGTDPADLKGAMRQGFGKFLYRNEGGMSIDGMAEALAQYGYLTKDENGRVDMREFEDKFGAELSGDTQFSNAYAPEQFQKPEIANPLGLTAGRLDVAGLAEIGLPVEIQNHLKALRMTAKDGLHPDLVAELFGFSSGDELVRQLAATEPPKDAINGLTDQRMLEQYGELASPEAIERSADAAIHNEVRAKMVATELNAVERIAGSRKTLAKAARQYAEAMIARLVVRNVKPGQYAAAEARAAKASAEAMKAGDSAKSAAEKRNQLINLYATKAAYAAQEEVDKIVRYLKKFDTAGSRKKIDVDYLDQIDRILERFDLKPRSLVQIDKRASLAKWLASQEEAGLEPDLPDYLVDEANRTHYKNLTVEQLRGLADSVRQIEHLGRLKNKLLTAKDQRELDAIVQEIAASLEQNANGRVVDNERRNTVQSKVTHAARWMMAAHRKAASLVREMDGFKDGGPLWEYFIRSMNEAGEHEATMRAEASLKLHELAKGVLTGEKMGGKGKFFPSMNRSFNRGERIAMALNIGNESNLQRLLGGKGWTIQQIRPVLDTLTAEDWKFVQGVWDFFEGYRDRIGAKQKRVYGTEPDWIEPGNALLTDIAVATQIPLRGGYYPVKYDPMQSGKAGEHADAEEAKSMMRAAYTAATTRRSFTKNRAEEVHGRPLVLTFDGVWQGANEVIHDLAWHEWLMDANRLLKRLDGPMRTHYGAQAVDAIKRAVKATADGDIQSVDNFVRSLNHIRAGSTVVGLGWNLVTSLLQPLGLTNSIVRVGSAWVGKGLMQFYVSPIKVAEEVSAKSEFMRNRARTMQREINEIQNQIESDKSDTRLWLEGSFFVLIQKCQAMVDYPTWIGGYEKAIAEGNDEARAIALADQAVIDSQGGGQVKDLASVQRGHPAWKLFTNFYSFFNVALNLSVERAKATDFKKPKEVMGLAADYLLILVIPSVLGTILKSVIKGGDDDEEKLLKKVAEDQIGFLMGMFVGVREFTTGVQSLAGVANPGLGYSGPAGVRLMQEFDKLTKQIQQGEPDMALFKSANNVGGILFHYPAGQINRMVEGTAALLDGRTNNPLAPLVGPPPKD